MMLCEKGGGGMTEQWDELYPGGSRFCFGDGVFKPSTDTFLLGDFASVNAGERVCDLGAGMGLLGLLLLSRQPECRVTNVELNGAACAMAEKNAAANGLDDRMVTVQSDLRCRETLPPANSFDVCVTNPPYFPAGSGRVAPGARGSARAETCCTLEDVCAASSYLLRSGGRLYLIHRAERLAELMEVLRRHRLEPKTLRFVQKDASAVPRLVLLGCRRDGGTGLVISPPLLLQTPEGAPSEELDRIYFRDRG